MAAPKGNKLALGNKGGRPRTVSPPKEDLDLLGQEMVEWVKKNDPLHLSQWWRAQKGMSYNQWKTLIQRDEFIPHYNISMGLIAHKYLDGTVNSSIAHRFVRIVFPEVKEEEDEKVAYEAKIKSQESKPPHDPVIDSLLDTIKSLKDAQSKTD